MSDLFVDNIKHQSSQGSGTITLGTSGETIALASGAEVSGFTGQNYPAFEAILTSDQSMTDQVTSTLIFDTERFDTDSCYDTATGIFTPTVAGKYFIYAGCQLRNSTSSQVNASLIQIFLNNTTYANSSVNENQGNPVYGQQNVVNGVLDLNGSTDNIRITAYIDVGSGSPVARAATDRRTYFGAYRIGA